jgi:hypothetical protein
MMMPAERMFKVAMAARVRKVSGLDRQKMTLLDLNGERDKRNLWKTATRCSADFALMYYSTLSAYSSSQAPAEAKDYRRILGHLGLGGSPLPQSVLMQAHHAASVRFSAEAAGLTESSQKLLVVPGYNRKGAIYFPEEGAGLLKVGALFHFFCHLFDADRVPVELPAWVAFELILPSKNRDGRRQIQEILADAQATRIHLELCAGKEPRYSVIIETAI